MFTPTKYGNILVAVALISLMAIIAFNENEKQKKKQQSQEQQHADSVNRSFDSLLKKLEDQQFGSHFKNSRITNRRKDLHVHIKDVGNIHVFVDGDSIIVSKQ